MGLHTTMNLTAGNALAIGHDIVFWGYVEGNRKRQNNEDRVEPGQLCEATRAIKKWKVLKLEVWRSSLH